MVLGKLPVPGRPTIWITVGQEPTALAVGADGGCLAIFIFICPFSPLSPSPLETARYRLKCCLKGPLNPKQPANHIKWYYVNFQTGVICTVASSTSVTNVHFERMKYAFADFRNCLVRSVETITQQNANFPFPLKRLRVCL